MLGEERREQPEEVEDREAEEMLRRPHGGFPRPAPEHLPGEGQHAEPAEGRNRRVGEPAEAEGGRREAERREQERVGQDLPARRVRPETFGIIGMPARA